MIDKFSSGKELKLLQLARAIAAILVFIFHSDDRILPIFGLSAYKPYLGFGQYGVDVFFVISGFVMAYIHLKRSESLRRFAIKRVIRIYPVYIGCIILVTPIMLLDYMHKDLGKLDYLGMIFLHHPTNNDNFILSVAWTLSYELWFYFVFGVAMHLFGKKFIWGILLFASMTAANQCFGSEKFFLGWRNFEFCAGAIIAVLLGQKIEVWDQKVKIPAIMILIGNASYSIYLLHIPLLEILSKIVEKKMLSSFWPINVFLCVAIVSIIFGLAICHYEYVEKRIIRVCREKFLSKK